MKCFMKSLLLLSFLFISLGVAETYSQDMADCDTTIVGLSSKMRFNRKSSICSDLTKYHEPVGVFFITHAANETLLIEFGDDEPTFYNSIPVIGAVSIDFAHPYEQFWLSTTAGSVGDVTVSIFWYWKKP